MARLIDAEKLKNFLDGLIRDEWNKNATTSWADALEEVSELVESIAPIDAVPVVKCKDCKNYVRHDHRCGRMNHGFDGDFFCSWGERINYGSSKAEEDE